MDKYRYIYIYIFDYFQLTQTIYTMLFLYIYIHTYTVSHFHIITGSMYVPSLVLFSNFAYSFAPHIQIDRQYRWHTDHVTSPCAILGALKNSQGLCLTRGPCARLVLQHGVPSILRPLYFVVHSSTQ